MESISGIQLTGSEIRFITDYPLSFVKTNLDFINEFLQIYKASGQTDISFSYKLGTQRSSSSSASASSSVSFSMVEAWNPPILRDSIVGRSIQYIDDFMKNVLLEAGIISDGLYMSQYYQTHKRYPDSISRLMAHRAALVTKTVKTETDETNKIFNVKDIMLKVDYSRIDPTTGADCYTDPIIMQFITTYENEIIPELTSDPSHPYSKLMQIIAAQHIAKFIYMNTDHSKIPSFVPKTVPYERVDYFLKPIQGIRGTNAIIIPSKFIHRFMFSPSISYHLDKWMKSDDAFNFTLTKERGPIGGIVLPTTGVCTSARLVQSDDLKPRDSTYYFEYHADDSKRCHYLKYRFNSQVALLESFDGETPSSGKTRGSLSGAAASAASAVSTTGALSQGMFIFDLLRNRNVFSEKFMNELKSECCRLDK